MQEERLVNLAVLSVEREISQTLNLEDVVDKFCAIDKNQRIMLIMFVCIFTFENNVNSILGIFMVNWVLIIYILLILACTPPKCNILHSNSRLQHLRAHITFKIFWGAGPI